jgi:hypothetical protein
MLKGGVRGLIIANRFSGTKAGVSLSDYVLDQSKLISTGARKHSTSQRHLQDA